MDSDTSSLLILLAIIAAAILIPLVLIGALLLNVVGVGDFSSSALGIAMLTRQMRSLEIR